MRWLSRTRCAFGRVMALGFNALLIAGGAVACAPTPSTVARPVALPHRKEAVTVAPRVVTPPVTITVHEDPAHDTWRVSYQLAQAATRVIITDRFEDYRPQHWVAKTADGHVVPWTRIEHHNALVFARPSSRFDISFGTYCPASTTSSRQRQLDLPISLLA